MTGKGEGPAIEIDLGTDDLMLLFGDGVIHLHLLQDFLFLFHPSCMGMTIEEAKKLDHFLCSDCSSKNEANRSLNAFPVSPSAEAKNNNISGPIPIELGTVPLLQTLDLSNNQFSCPIPTSFAQLNGLHYLPPFDFFNLAFGLSILSCGNALNLSLPPRRLEVRSFFFFSLPRSSYNLGLVRNRQGFLTLPQLFRVLTPPFPAYRDVAASSPCKTKTWLVNIPDCGCTAGRPSGWLHLAHLPRPPEPPLRAPLLGDIFLISTSNFFSLKQ
ncbi:protein mlo2-like isoform X2 [Cucumis melo var. makuwa]|uniref:Protein mlo2-like isoform X2 n=1 Tax=Cucumis melo var. makuwa TaxID=1194695 RepID=A0A5A7UF44_CUCMM|nr:protein mlo2-like isoform X2 [Cucumis melo var. makuwa]